MIERSSVVLKLALAGWKEGKSPAVHCVLVLGRGKWLELVVIVLLEGVPALVGLLGWVEGIAVVVVVELSGHEFTRLNLKLGCLWVKIVILRGVKCAVG